MLRGILDNDSIFGQIMLRCWAVIACNLCFVITVIPVVTIGAGWAAMDYALMNTIKNRDSAAPFTMPSPFQPYFIRPSAAARNTFTVCGA